MDFVTIPKIPCHTRCLFSLRAISTFPRLIPTFVHLNAALKGTPAFTCNCTSMLRFTPFD